MRALSTISGHPDTRTAALEITEGLEKALEGDSPVAILLLASFHHASALPAVSEHLGAHFQPQALIGGTAQTVFAGLEASERRSGLAAFVLAGTGLVARSFLQDWDRGPAELTTPDGWRALASTGADHAATILLADPFTTDPRPVFEAFDHGVPGPVGGGLLSGSTRPGGNVLIADRARASTGLVGLGIGGAIRCESLVSQGCRPIGVPMVVTGADHGSVTTLGGRPAAEAAREAILGLDEDDRRLVSHGLRLGLAVTEYQSRFGANDFVVREITGVDERTGALQVSERPAVGRTVQFHVRDPERAGTDLDLALDVQALDDTPPLGILLAESTVRGVPGTDLQRLRDRLGRVPVTGLVCAGEFSRREGRTMVHGSSANALIFRAGAAPSNRRRADKPG